jgi:uncharacterized protein (TIGR01777 family)
LARFQSLIPFDCNWRSHAIIGITLNITITGATGLIGRRLLTALARSGHSLRALSRHSGANLPPGVKLSVWDAMKGAPPAEALQEADAVIHLAGEPVAQRWTAEAKRRIRESRVDGTRRLVEAIAAQERKPAVLIAASATGYYGSRGDQALEETTPPGQGFLAELCVEWEREALAAASLGVRAAAIRTGIALHPQGGALGKMLPAFRLGAGGRLGSGKQWFPWIHLDDLIAIYSFVLENEIAGPLNGTAPRPVTNAEFTRALARAVHRPAIFPVPKLALQIAFGEMSEALFESERVLPKRLEAEGFRFRYPEIGAALEQLLQRSKTG